MRSIDIGEKRKICALVIMLFIQIFFLAEQIGYGISLQLHSLEKLTRIAMASLPSDLSELMSCVNI
jgi:hypothetical protein